MHFFYVLVNGVTWKLASMLVSGNFKYEKTLNRLFNKYSKDNIFRSIYDELDVKYKKNTFIENLKIDSTDIINGNCNKNDLGKSWKLHKQAIKATFIIDNNNIHLCYSLENPTSNDSKVGHELINLKLTKNKCKRIYLAGDKGYILNKTDNENILKTKNIMMVTPKKRYKNKKKNKYYKKKIVRHSRKMEEVLSKRIYIEHFNSKIHRSYKRLDKIFDKSISIFKSFVDIALSIIIIQNLFV